jgi:hypothetical protein
LHRLWFKPTLSSIDGDIAIFSWPTIAVDTHIFRVSNRMNFAPGANVDQVE